MNASDEIAILEIAIYAISQHTDQVGEHVDLSDEELERLKSVAVARQFNLNLDHKGDEPCQQ